MTLQCHRTTGVLQVISAKCLVCCLFWMCLNEGKLINRNAVKVQDDWQMDYCLAATYGCKCLPTAADPGS